MKKQKLAFTLVELIVVITILAILGTIAFISLQNYGSQARDSKRLSDIQNIKKSLELFSLNTGFYPFPDNPKEIKYNGDLVRTQGIVGENVIKNLNKNLSSLPLDPKSELEYTYSLINSKNKYELLSIYESDLVSQNKLINSSFAVSSDYYKIDGTYNGIFVKTNSYYIPTPSIINSTNIGSFLILNSENIKSQIISGGKNKIEIGLSEASTGKLDINLIVYTGSITKKSSDEDKLDLAEIIQNAYTGSSLANIGVYKDILEKVEIEDLVSLVDNVVLNSVSNISNVSNDGENSDDGDIPPEDLGTWSGNSSSAYVYTNSLGEIKYPKHCNDLLVSSDVNFKQLIDGPYNGTGFVDGIYTIDPDGIGGNSQFNVYCGMSTNGGGWTYLMNPIILGLSAYSDNANVTYYTSGPNCRTEELRSDSNWYFSYSYVCASYYSSSTFTWNNNLGASEVMFRAVANGLNRVLTINGVNAYNYSNGYNLFALDSGTCSYNTCWENETFKLNAVPTVKNFSGNLSIYAKGQGDNASWGGASSIWGVAVR